MVGNSFRCVLSPVYTSGGKTIPIGAVFGLEEDRRSLDQLFALFRQRCDEKGVPCPQFNLRDHDRKLIFLWVYTLTPQPELVPERLIPEEVLSWNRKNLRTFSYPPAYEIFMNLLHKDDDAAALIAALPAPAALEATLHSDAAPAFVGLTKCGVRLSYTWNCTTNTAAGTSPWNGPHVQSTMKPTLPVYRPKWRNSPWTFFTEGIFPFTWPMRYEISFYHWRRHAA